MKFDSWIPNLFEKGRFPHLARLSRLMGMRVFLVFALINIPVGIIRNLWIGRGPGLIQAALIVFLGVLLRLRLRYPNIRRISFASLLMFPLAGLMALYWKGDGDAPTLLVFPVLVFMLAFSQDRAILLVFGGLGLLIPFLFYGPLPPGDVQPVLRRWNLAVLTLASIFIVLAYRLAVSRAWAALLEEQGRLKSSIQATRDLTRSIASGLSSSLRNLREGLGRDTGQAGALGKAMQQALIAARRTLAESSEEKEVMDAEPDPGLEARHLVLRASLLAGISAALLNLCPAYYYGGVFWPLSLLNAVFLAAIFMALDKKSAMVRRIAVFALVSGILLAGMAGWNHPGPRAGHGVILMAGFIAFAALAHSAALGIAAMGLALLYLARDVAVHAPASLQGANLAWNSNLALLLLSYGLVAYWCQNILQIALRLSRRRAERLRAAQTGLVLAARNYVHDLANPVMELNLNLRSKELSPGDRQSLALLVDRLETLLTGFLPPSQKPVA